MRHAVTAALAASLLAATASPALAGPPGRTAPMGWETPTAPEAPRLKSESTATLLAIGATLGGFALIGAGAERGNDGVMATGMAVVLIGPSAGHFYADETGHAVKMSLLRTGGALVLGMGLIASFNTEDVQAGAPCPVDDATCTTTPTHHHSDDRTAERMMWLGGGVLVAATLYDLWDAHRAARRTNETARRAWTIAPMVTNGGGGFSVGGAF
ncbi:MAG: hypothetical protein JNL83_35380 [Myxococcales bacterium]|nr:hypothetical protein [Myxococcales bacterium]